jgi:GAF domain-containing protein
VRWKRCLLDVGTSFTAKYMSIRPVILKYRSLAPWLKSVISAILFVLPVLGSAFLSYYLRLSLEKTFQLQVAVVVSLFFVYALARSYIELRMELLDKMEERHRGALAQAYVTLDKTIAVSIGRLHEAIDECNRPARDSSEKLSTVLFGSLDRIQTLVNALYEVVQGQFGQAGGSLLDEIDFEVTFMTKSYVDGEITIYASQNREHRAPRSLLLRRDDKTLYKNTVTAEIYREVRPEIHIIDDTSLGNYHAVYAGQLDRIKSSVVYPVLSDKSELLGTLVVHCNKARFFSRADAKFWIKLLEIYAKRVGFEKMKLDCMMTLDLSKFSKAISEAILRPDH